MGAVVRTTMAGGWTRLTPAQVQVARQDAVNRTLHRVLGQPDVAAHLELARDATTALEANGRPLSPLHLGVEGTTRLGELLAPISGALLDSDVFPAGSPLQTMG